MQYLTLEEVAERIQVMRRQEETIYQCHDYLRLSSVRRAPSKPVVMDVDCRTKLCEWIHKITDFYTLRQEIADIAMSYLDRFLATGGRATVAAWRDPECFQVVGITSLYMAIKLNAGHRKASIFLCELGERHKSLPLEQQVVEMESKMLKALQWRVHGPTRLHFAQHLMCLFPGHRDKASNACTAKRPAATMMTTTMTTTTAGSAKRIVDKLTRFQTELVTGDYFFVSRRPSSVALACILNAMDALLSIPLLQGEDTDWQSLFLESIAQHGGGVDPFAQDVQEAQCRLLKHHVSMSELGQMAHQLALKLMRQTTSEKLQHNHNSNTVVQEHASDQTKQEEMSRSFSYSSPVCVSHTAVPNHR